MNSCLYACDVMHYRLEPKKNRFSYRLFMFYLDLDELDLLHKTFRSISRNARNLFEFRDKDHLCFPAPARLSDEPTTKANVIRFLQANGVAWNGGRIMLLTHLRMMGHIFNPVSFYFCFDENGQPLCTVSEVQNTFREMKPYVLPKDYLRDGVFHRRVVKDFYVSPFIALDASFDFRLGIPGDRLALHIDDYQEGRKFFLSSLTGVRRSLTDARLWLYALSFPWITVRILFLIHWQAFRLWLKDLPYFRKADHPEMQTGFTSLKHRS